ncbi:MAG: amino acid synthesis family protein [Deltaproteobacteria bacterium]|nr:MAG: amino acid synthesis family protein [Deltaproteobacteria bacterium]
MEIRKIITVVEETHRESGKEVSPPTRKAAAVAVIKNPFAGQYAEDLSLLMDYGERLGGMLGEKAVAALGIPKERVESYGKAAVVGLGGELEHAAAILHPKLGKPLREAVGGGKAIIPSAKKMGGAGTPIDVPLHYKDAAFVRSHFDAMEIRVTDAPRDDEIVVAIAVTDSGRPLARVGGLKKEEVKGEDGLR